MKESRLYGGEVVRVEQFVLGGGVDDVTAFGVYETVADRLRASAAYIRGHWTVGMLCTDDGLVCAVGALLGLRERAENCEMGLLALDRVADEAVTLVADYVTEHHHLLRHLADSDGVRVSLVEQWNDDHVRDGVEVAEVFEKVAARWEERTGA
jgi:hypothetical protein